MSKEGVHVSVKGGMGILTLDSGDYNTLSSNVILELGSKFQDLEDRSEVKVILITGYPKSFFSAGADVKEIFGMIKGGDKQAANEAIKLLQEVYLQIDNSKKLTVAAVNGYCLGGGLELALTCDFRIANQEATFGLPEVDLGIMPGLGGTQRLPRLIGLKNAARIVLGGKKAMIGPGSAQALGLVDRVIKGDFIAGVKDFVSDLINNRNISSRISRVQDETLEGYLSEERVKALIADKAKSAVDMIFRALNEGYRISFKDGLETERALFLEQAFSPDGLEGIAAFLEKRVPKFKTTQPIEAKPTPISENRSSTKDLSEEYTMLRQTLRKFGENEVRPKIEAMEKAENIFPEIYQKIAELGFLGIPFAEAYGGAGLGKTGQCIMAEELGRVHASLAVLVGASVGLAGGSLALFGTEAQKQKYLRAIAEGQAIGAFALTEAEAGSDVANLSSLAERHGDQWVINGTKQFISNGDIADLIIIFAKTDPDLGAHGISAFIIESNYPGLKTIKIEHKMGIRASRTTSMEFTDMAVPAENMLGQLGQGFKIALNVLNYGRLSLAAGCLGASKRAFELAYAHASQRSQMGKKILEFQLTQEALAIMRSHIFLMEQSVYNVAAMADRGEDIRLESAIMKLTASEMSEWDIRKALQIHGGLGYLDEYEISRMFRDSIINSIFEGTNEIQKLLIFKDIFKSEGKV
ncbi:MAG: acyl-CoA dehydrogenase family protein [Parcubacteria group bacterium]|nr:acyl-CoA dehydrogenase family protein [Parcubacteria group bacterium]